MKKVSGLVKGYYIRIIDGFYEVIDGNRAIYYGECQKNSTIQEIANKTILLNQEDTYVRLRRIKGNIGQCREKRSFARDKDNGAENLISV